MACTSTRTTSWSRSSIRQTGEPVPEGKEGELVFTSLTKEALPVIRYRTGDLASMSYRPCVCGRVFARHSKVYARTDDMLVIRGINVYPSSDRSGADGDREGRASLPDPCDYREGALDQIEVQIEVEPAFLPDAVKKLMGFQRARGGEAAAGTGYPSHASGWSSLRTYPVGHGPYRSECIDRRGSISERG